MDPAGPIGAQNAQNMNIMPVSNQPLLITVQMELEIKSCNQEHVDELQLYSTLHNTALCNECFFENQEHWGKTLTLK